MREAAPRLLKARAVFSPISPAPTRRIRADSRPPNMLRAKSTATLATLTCPSVIAVVLRACLAAWNAFWKSGLGDGPRRLHSGRRHTFTYFEDFRLSEHLGPSPAATSSRCCNRPPAPQKFKRDHPKSRGKIRWEQKASSDLGDGACVGADPVEFDSVAGVQDRELLKGAQAGKDSLKCRFPLLGKGQFFPHFDGCLVMVGAQDENDGGTHGVCATGAAGCRLALTGSSESRAPAKRIRQVQANRR